MVLIGNFIEVQLLCLISFDDIHREYINYYQKYIKLRKALLLHVKNKFILNLC